MGQERVQLVEICRSITSHNPIHVVKHQADCLAGWASVWRGQGSAGSLVDAAGELGGLILHVFLVQEGISAEQHHVQDAAQAPVVHWGAMRHAVSEDLRSCMRQHILRRQVMTDKK